MGIANIVTSYPLRLKLTLPGILCASLSFLFLSTVIGQEMPSVRFDTQAQYAGARNPGETSVEFTYMFTNTGNTPVQVSGVNPCRNCEVVALSKGHIKPGGRGFVALRYQLPPQPGRFMENSDVFINNELNKPLRLTFSGEMLPTPKDKSQIYAYCYGDLCFREAFLDMGKVLNTNFIIKDFSVFNGGNIPLELAGTPFHPFLIADVFPSPLMPGEKGTLKVTYRATHRQAFGPLLDTLRLVSLAEDLEPIEVYLKTHIEEDFSKLKPDQLSISPQVSFSETRQDIGAIRRGDEAMCRFEVRNKGKRQLIIRSLYSSSPMLQMEMPNRVLRQGQTGEVIVRLTASAPKGQFLESITIVCNDPKRPEAKLYVQGVIID